VPVIAVTGHMNLSPESASVVRQAIVDLLAKCYDRDLTGITCLARGADSIFAEAVLHQGGRLVVILPSSTYRATKVKPDYAQLFDSLIGHAAQIRTLPFSEANRDAYDAANQLMLDSCDELFAVWDGLRGVDRGSTASVVAEARRRGIPVHVIWPDGATRQ
jgi:hypothetical protein